MTRGLLFQRRNMLDWFCRMALMVKSRAAASHVGCQSSRSFSVPACATATQDDINRYCVWEMKTGSFSTWYQRWSGLPGITCQVGGIGALGRAKLIQTDGNAYTMSGVAGSGKQTSESGQNANSIVPVFTVAARPPEVLGISLRVQYFPSKDGAEGMTLVSTV